jgi:hypothetical protein
MTVQFKKATKAQSRARIALIGPAGSGKTWTALALATALGQRVAVIDTERGSASKYADLFGFDVLELETFDPRTYIAAIDAAQTADYDVLVIDSLSHAWTGKGGVLDIKDAATRRSKSNDSFGAGWREASPLHNQLVDAMLQCRVHLIATMRAKTEYLVTRNAKGETKIEKVGLAPVQRDGLEYEFDIVGDMDGENNLAISETRCPTLQGAVFNRPDAKVAEVISDWLSDGVVVEEGPIAGAVTTTPAPAMAARPMFAGLHANTAGYPTGWRIPTLEQIDTLRDPNDVKALVGDQDTAPEYREAVKRVAIGMAGGDWAEIWRDTHIDAWQHILTEALGQLSAAGHSPPPAADQTSPSAQVTKRKGDQAGGGDPPSGDGDAG